MFFLGIDGFLYIGVTEQSILDGTLGLYLTIASTHTLYKVRAGKALTMGGFKSIDKI